MAIDPNAVPYACARRELEWPSTLSRGTRGKRVRALQEWLSLNRFGTAIDGDFGPATELAVGSFQSKANLPATGSADAATWEALVAPLVAALKPVAARGKDLPALVSAYAQQRLKQSPREIGGENCGPWVRVYAGGHDGRDWPWCAGFVTFMVRQVADALDVSMPIKGSVSCDTLAMQAREPDCSLPSAMHVEHRCPTGPSSSIAEPTRTGLTPASSRASVPTLSRRSKAIQTTRARARLTKCAPDRVVMGAVTSSALRSGRREQVWTG